VRRTRRRGRRGVDGIVCGHIHRPEIVELAGLLYCNDGDWVDSCSALIEDRSGELELWHWKRYRSALRPVVTPRAEARPPERC